MCWVSTARCTCLGGSTDGPDFHPSRWTEGGGSKVRGLRSNTSYSEVHEESLLARDRTSVPQGVSRRVSTPESRGHLPTRGRQPTVVHLTLLWSPRVRCRVRRKTTFSPGNRLRYNDPTGLLPISTLPGRASRPSTGRSRFSSRGDSSTELGSVPLRDRVPTFPRVR